MASATSAIIVFAQELMPHRLGMISGLFFGFAFGFGGLGAALLGRVADGMGIDFVYQVCAYLPAIGLLSVFLPNLKKTAQSDHVDSDCARRASTLDLNLSLGLATAAWRKRAARVECLRKIRVKN